MSYFSNNYGAVQYTLASENSVGLRNAQIGAIHSFYQKLSNYVFQRLPLASLLNQYNREIDIKEDTDGKSLYGILLGELRSMRKDREELVEIIVIYLLETDLELVDQVADYLYKKISENTCSD